jgi:hypothetical protein
MLLGAPVPKNEQSYVVNIFIKIIIHFCRICPNDFLGKNNYIFVPTFCRLPCYAKTHLW